MVGYQLDSVRKNFSHIGKRHLVTAQRGKCFYCGRFMASAGMTRDHLWPRSKGHTLRLNQVICCAGCNRKKGCRLPTDRELAKARVLYVKLGAPAFVF